MADLQTVDIAGVELARTGSWIGTDGRGRPARVSLTRQDFDAMIAAEQAARSTVGDEADAPVKIGHDALQQLFGDLAGETLADGEPALGWVRNLRRVGDTLVGDLRKVPAMLAQFLQAGTWRRRSIEFDYDYALGGKRHPIMLTGLALLGALPPAVEGLADLYSVSRPRPAGYRVQFAGPAKPGRRSALEMYLSDFQKLLERGEVLLEGRKGARRVRALIAAALDEFTKAARPEPPNRRHQEATMPRSRRRQKRAYPSLAVARLAAWRRRFAEGDPLLEDTGAEAPADAPIIESIEPTPEEALATIAGILGVSLEEAAPADIVDGVAALVGQPMPSEVAEEVAAEMADGDEIPVEGEMPAEPSAEMDAEMAMARIGELLGLMDAPYADIIVAIEALAADAGATPADPVEEALPEMAIAARRGQNARLTKLETELRQTKLALRRAAAERQVDADLTRTKAAASVRGALVKFAMAGDRQSYAAVLGTARRVPTQERGSNGGVDMSAIQPTALEIEVGQTLGVTPERLRAHKAAAAGINLPTRGPRQTERLARAIAKALEEVGE